MKAQVMKRAWSIAKGAVKRFGGKVREYFAQALKMAWAEIKGGRESKENKKANFEFLERSCLQHRNKRELCI